MGGEYLFQPKLIVHMLFMEDLRAGNIMIMCIMYMMLDSTISGRWICTCQGVKADLVIGHESQIFSTHSSP